MIWLPIDIHSHRHKLTNNTQYDYFENNTDICKYYVIDGTVKTNMCKYTNIFTNKTFYNCGYNNSCPNKENMITETFVQSATNLFNCPSINDDFIQCSCDRNFIMCYNLFGVYYKYNYCIYNNINITNKFCSKCIYIQNDNYYSSYQMQPYILLPIIFTAISTLLLFLFVLSHLIDPDIGSSSEEFIIISPLAFLGAFGFVTLSVFMSLKLSWSMLLVFLLGFFCLVFPITIILLGFHFWSISALAMYDTYKYISPILTSVYFIICMAFGIPLTIMYKSFRPYVWQSILLISICICFRYLINCFWCFDIFGCIGYHDNNDICKTKVSNRKRIIIKIDNWNNCLFDCLFIK